MHIPDELNELLLRPFYLQQESFERLVSALDVVLPDVTIEAHNRYSAFYLNTRPLVYIEPQVNGIKFGFFRDDILAYYKINQDQFCDFPRWNESRGGLVGFMLSGFDEVVAKQLTILSMLIIQSYRERTNWPSCG